MPYKVKGKCVYLKSTGKKVGCTKGSVKKYLSALHANVNESEEDELDWIRDSKPDPFTMYQAEGFFDVGIRVHSVQEANELLRYMYSMGYSWFSGDETYDGYLDFDFDEYGRGIIWGDRDKKISHSSYYHEPREDEIIIDNPFNTTSLNESENDDLDWIREIPASLGDNVDPEPGQLLMCLPGFNSNVSQPYKNEEEDPYCAGRGYYPGRIIKVGDVSYYPNNPLGKKYLIWPDAESSKYYWDYPKGVDDDCFDCGIYGLALAYVSKHVKGRKIKESEGDDLDWIRDTKPNPLEFYYNKGYNDIGLIINSYEETQRLIEFLHIMEYKWEHSERDYNPFSPNDFIDGERGVIWANKDKIIQHSDLTYEPREDEIIIDNPFNTTSLKESEEDDFDWIRDVQPCSAEFPCVGMRFKVILDDNIVDEVIYEISSIDDESFYLNWGDYPERGIVAASNVKWGQKHYYQYLNKNKIKVIGSSDKINESGGISFEAREWSDIVEGEILNNPQERTRIIIDGYDYPDTFEKFPIDYIVIDFHDNITGYDHTKSGYDKDGNYVVLLYIQPQLIQGVRDYTLKSALNHEFRHAYEDYQRRSKGKPTIDQTRDSKLFYTQDLIRLINNKEITGPIKEILRFYYYVSNIEKSAYMENIYDMNREYERIIREIISKDFESYKDRFDLDINWHLVNVAYDIPIVKKFKSPRKFIDYSAKFLRQKALKILKKINKVKYIHNKM